MDNLTDIHQKLLPYHPQLSGSGLEEVIFVVNRHRAAEISNTSYGGIRIELWQHDDDDCEMPIVRQEFSDETIALRIVTKWLNKGNQ